MENSSGLSYLKVLIGYYKSRVNSLTELKELSYTAFVDYVNAKEICLELQNLYYKLTDKEYI